MSSRRTPMYEPYRAAIFGTDTPCVYACLILPTGRRWRFLAIRVSFLTAYRRGKGRMPKNRLRMILETPDRARCVNVCNVVQEITSHADEHPEAEQSVFNQSGRLRKSHKTRGFIECNSCEPPREIASEHRNSRSTDVWNALVDQHRSVVELELIMLLVEQWTAGLVVQLGDGQHRCAVHHKSKLWRLPVWMRHLEIQVRQ